MLRVCLQCGDEFDADTEWKKICLPCWRSNKAKEEGPKRKSKGFSGSSPKGFSRQSQAIPADMLKTLINLCHPDRHGGKESATRATQFLLSLRGKQ